MMRRQKTSFKDISIDIQFICMYVDEHHHHVRHGFIIIMQSCLQNKRIAGCWQIETHVNAAPSNLNFTMTLLAGAGRLMTVTAISVAADCLAARRPSCWDLASFIS
jgi:hypothetical protein